MFKISARQYNDFLIDFYAGEYPHQRLGQAFHNLFVPEGTFICMENGRDIFFAPDSEVKDFLASNIVDWSEY